MDIIIVGGGLAGCALAWQCRSRGLRIKLIDQPRADSASRVAAGLVTPVTGSRFAVSWRWTEFFPDADALYRHAEWQSGESFWSVAPAWRAFTSYEEATFCNQRCLTPGNLIEKAGIRIEVLPAARLPASLADGGGISMEPAARLDVPAYLDATRRVLEVEDMLVSIDLDVDRDLHPQTDRIEIPRLGLASRWAVLCQGFLARTNRWFSGLPLHPARGDILLIRSPGLQLDHVLHHKGWIVPLPGEQYLMGATYDRHALTMDGDDDAATRWRADLCQRWTAMTGQEFNTRDAEILGHRIAIRPATYDRHPLIGAHSRCPHLWCLNGLGSKGSLMAPRLASHLMDSMLGGHPIDASLILSRRSFSE